MSAASKKGFVALKGNSGRPVEAATKIGPVDGNEDINATIYLRRRAGHDPLPNIHNHQLHTPNNRVSTDEFAARFGASEEDIALVKGFCNSVGLHVIETHSARRQVKISGTISQFNTAFSLDIQHYTKIDSRKKKEVTFRAHEDISVPVHLSDVIMGIFGIGTEPIYQTHTRVLQQTQSVDRKALSEYSVIGTPSSVSHFNYPQQQGSLYNFPTTPYSLGGIAAPNGFVATEQTVGIISLSGDGYDLGDIHATFANSNKASTLPPGAVGYPANNLGYPYLSTGDPLVDGPNVPALNIVDVFINGATNPGNIGSTFETLVDICQIFFYSTTPKVAVYFPTATTDINDVFSRMVHPNPGDPICNILSFSFGIIEISTFSAQFAVADTIFQDAATLGITVISSSGDTGTADPNLSDTDIHASWPASSPWVTSVGGTVIGNVVVNDLTKPVTASTSFTEWVWNETGENQNFGVSGGGISILYPIPSYQSSVALPVELDTKLAGRGVPDIAGNASPYSGVVVLTRDSDSSSPTYNQRVGYIIGGTSITVPMYAGMVAVINTKLGLNIGFLNPLLYKIGNTNSSILRDIIVQTDSAGRQSATGNGGYHGISGYSVTPGWDACTGLGVINGGNLLAYLRNNPIPPTPPSGPPAASPIAITGITVSSTTFSSAQPVGSIVALISVNTTGGAFDKKLGTIINTLSTNSGPNLAVTKNSNVVIINAPFTPGNYVAQFTATQASLVGSPFTSPVVQFTVTAPATPPPPAPPPPSSFSDPITYKISSSLASTGPWVDIPNSPFSSLNAAVTGLSPSTTYYFQITPQDRLFGIVGNPYVIGPINTSTPATNQISTHGITLDNVKGTIIDPGLNVWTLAQTPTASGFQVTINNTVIPTSPDVSSLILWNGLIYYSTLSNQWFVYNGTGWSSVPGDPRITESLHGSTVSDPEKFILDSFNNLWSLHKTSVPGFQVTQNGLVDISTKNVILLLYYQHQLYLQNSDLSWLIWSGSAWNLSSDPRNSPNIPSPNGSVLSSTQGIIIDLALNKWSLLLDSSGSGLQVSKNDILDTTTQAVQNLLYWDAVVYIKTSNGNWSFWNGNVWVIARGDPRASPITWNLVDKSINILLTNGFVTATSVGAFPQGVRSKVGYSSGSYFFEVTADIVTSGFSVGISTSMYYLSGSRLLGSDPTGIGFHCVDPPQSIFTGSDIAKQIGNGVSTDGEIISCAINFDRRLVWFSTFTMRAQGATWNNVPGASPSASVGGIAFSIGTGPYFVTFNDNIGGAVATVNFGGSPFSLPIPAGFAAWSSEGGSANAVNSPTFNEEFD